MGKADTKAYGEGRVRGDSLRVMNLFFLMAIALTAIVIVYAYASTENWNTPSEAQTSPPPEGLKVQDATPPYEVISNKIDEFVEWE